jgi:hypothetical protein
LAVSDQGIELSEFFEACPSRLAMICALLAVLEMVRLGAIQLVQGELFSSIRVRKHKTFDAVFANADAADATAAEKASAEKVESEHEVTEGEKPEVETPAGEKPGAGKTDAAAEGGEESKSTNPLRNIDEQYQ